MLLLQDQTASFVQSEIVSTTLAEKDAQVHIGDHSFIVNVALDSFRHAILIYAILHQSLTKVCFKKQQVYTVKLKEMSNSIILPRKFKVELFVTQQNLSVSEFWLAPLSFLWICFMLYQRYLSYLTATVHKPMFPGLFLTST